MKRSKIKAIVIPGILCLLILSASIWYSVRYNESRLVVPTELETYQFCLKDIPMICSIAITIIYVCYLLACLGRINIHQKKNVLQMNRTRRISPKLVFLGSSVSLVL